MAQADDPEVPGHRPPPPAPSSRFWERYSGRAAETEEGAAADDAAGGAKAADDATGAAGGANDAAGAVDGGAGGAKAADGGEGAAGGANDAAEAAEAANDGTGAIDGHECLDWCPICRGAELLREAVPPELQEQLKSVQRDALLLAKAMIDAHLERLRTETEPPADPGSDDRGPDISSIPID